MSITATIKNNTNLSSNVRLGSGRLQDLNDLDSSNLSDGSVILYDGTTNQFKTTNTVETNDPNTGNLIINGGNF